MKLIILILCSYMVGLNSHSQSQNGFYKGLERISWKDDNGKVHYYDAPRKWYHENLLLVENDSFFMYKMPVQIVKKKKFYSASDGAFYYYYGKAEKRDTGTIINLISDNCDYCGQEVRIDTFTGFRYPMARLKSYKMETLQDRLKIGDVVYTKTSKNETDFPPKSMFYFDSNSIYRVDPKNQYKLIATAIKHFLQTKELKLDNDTLRISMDRKNNDSVVETLDPGKIEMDTTGVILAYYNQIQLKKLIASSNKPIRYIEVGEIIDYWNAARISLTYVISLPNTQRNFSERQYHIVLEYHKIGAEYILREGLPENGWQLVERK